MENGKDKVRLVVYTKHTGNFTYIMSRENADLIQAEFGNGCALRHEIHGWLNDIDGNEAHSVFESGEIVCIEQLSINKDF